MLLNYRMRFYLMGFFCVSLLFVACAGSDWRKIPPGIIPEHNFAEMLTEIHIADGSLSAYPNADSLAKHGMGLYLAIFKLHKTDSAEFRKSLKFYTTRPDILSEIYTGVNLRLEKKVDSLKKIIAKTELDSVNRTKAKQKLKADSVKKAGVKVKADSIVKANKTKDIPVPTNKHQYKFIGKRVSSNALPQQ